jgi:DNA-binding transcriptional LysR family regulator
VGATLIERSARRFALTDAGLTLVDEGQRLVNHADAVVENVVGASRGERGRVRLALLASCSLGVVGRALQVFRAEYPDVSVELLDDPPDAIAAVGAGILDGAMLRGPVDYPGIVAEVLVEEPLIAVVWASHPLARDERVAVRSLHSERFVLFKRSSSPPLYDTVIATCHGAGFVPHVIQEAAEWQTLAALVVCGTGITLVPRSAREVAHAELRYLDLEDAPETVSLVFARRLTGNRMMTDHLLHRLRAAASS